MRPLTCPIPSNINPLASNGFMFSILKLPEIQFFCQEANIPSIDAPAAQMETSLVLTPIPGDKLDFGDLSITFLIDEEMSNFTALHDWIIGLGFPESHAMYRNFISTRLNNLVTNELTAGYSDAVLQILNSSNNPIRTIRFVDVMPVSLSSLQLQSTTQETTYLAGQASFRYSFYKFE